MSARLRLDVPDELLETLAQRVAAILTERHIGGPDIWLTVAEAADYLRCPRSRLYALCSARRIPHVKDGSRTLFRRSELDRWLSDGGAKRP